jgi:hypothetical protein
VQSIKRLLESKVIATQNKLKAEQDLERIKVEAPSRVAQAEGEAKAISIQATAIQSNGGQNYVQLQWIDKWDGKLHQTMLGSDTRNVDECKMNERILELVEQAGMRSPDLFKLTVSHMSIGTLEKFAELIVRECGKSCTFQQMKMICFVSLVLNISELKNEYRRR